MEMVTAMLENANALLIMSMPKIAQFMDVSTENLCFSFYFYMNTRNQSLRAWSQNSRCGGILEQNRSHNHLLWAIVSDCSILLFTSTLNF